MKFDGLRLLAVIHALALMGTGAPAADDRTDVTIAEEVGKVSHAGIQSAFQILRSEYIRGEELTAAELNRAAFQGLLERLDLGAELIRRADIEKPLLTKGVVAEKLPTGILFLRPRALTEDEIPLVEKQLRQAVTDQIPYLVLDLRSPAGPGEFRVASALLDLFLPAGELMFKLKQVGRQDAELFISRQPPLWEAPVVVLVDSETSNVGETVAAVLHERGKALLIGGTTRGATVRFETLPLDEEWSLRLARAEVLLKNDHSIFKQGLKPDFPVELDLKQKRQLFSQNEAVKEGLFDRSRPRYNEAALIARKNPELESYIRRSAGEVLVDDRPAVRDTVLQRAVDMLTTRTHFLTSKLRWPTEGNRSLPVPPHSKSAPRP